MLELYHHGSSVCAAKVRLVLAEKNLEWTGHYLDILAGEQFNPDYLKLNPKAVVPTLIHDGEVITESTLICEYLDDAFTGHLLKPTEALPCARMRYWTKLVDEEVHPAVRPLTYVSTHRHTILKRAPAEVEEHIERDPNPMWRERKRGWIFDGFDAPDVRQAVLFFDDLLKRMDAILASHEWLTGNTYTMADSALTPYVNRLDILGFADMWSPHHHLRRWFDQVRNRPSFEPALFQYLPEDLRNDMRSRGRQAWPEVKKLLDNKT